MLGVLSSCYRYVRTRRYKTTVTAKIVPTYLPLHGFESDTIPNEETRKTGDAPRRRNSEKSVGEESLYM